MHETRTMDATRSTHGTRATRSTDGTRPSRAVRSRVATVARALACFASVGITAATVVASPLAAQQRPVQPDAIATPSGPWLIKTREHVDLWLHGFALLSPEDTNAVPLFRAGYADSMIVLRNRAGAFTALDSARTELQAGLRRMPQLVTAQFFALHFGIWDELRQVLTITTEAKGNPQRARDRSTQGAIMLGANYFATPEALAWASRYVTALQDESQRVHRQAWLVGQRERGPVLARVDSLWRARWFPAVRPFLRGTQQRFGEILLSPVLEGEGRTIVLDPNKGPTIVVGYPDTPAAATDVLYALAHEATASLAARAITENITPRQASQGLGDRLQSPAAIRGGLLLLQKALPAEAEGYARFYLRLMRKPVPPTGGAVAALIAATPLPPEIVEQMTSILSTYYEGI